MVLKYITGSGDPQLGRQINQYTRYAGRIPVVGVPPFKLMDTVFKILTLTAPMVDISLYVRSRKGRDTDGFTLSGELDRDTMIEEPTDDVASGDVLGLGF
jgi:threonine dehydrogenase-like Zn-dependent dehydrogenase